MHTDHEPMDWTLLPTLAARAGVSSAPLFPARGTFAPPRLAPLGALPAAQRTFAELRFPGELVRARAAEYAAEARQAGTPHTLRLWRESCHEALISLARAATATPIGALCASLVWQLDGIDYLLSITFALPASPTVH
ncbi:MAG: hypothetical protein IVW57_18895 [Ktedonobacterales bacterium]|nr:hypothetical protein [Ktedonobacterales bacterium]